MEAKVLAAAALLRMMTLMMRTKYIQLVFIMAVIITNCNLINFAKIEIAGKNNAMSLIGNKLEQLYTGCMMAQCCTKPPFKKIWNNLIG